MGVGSIVLLVVEKLRGYNAPLPIRHQLTLRFKRQPTFLAAACESHEKLNSGPHSLAHFVSLDTKIHQDINYIKSVQIQLSSAW